MKTNTLKKLRTAATVTVASLMVASTPLLGGIAKAFANDGQEAPAQEQSLSRTDWEAACVAALDKSIKLPRLYEESCNNDKDVWHVFQEADHFTTNTVYVKSINDAEGKESDFAFEYDYRGDLGNCHDCDYREPNVEFFYNSQKHTLYIAGFGPDRHDYDTYSYFTPSFRTVFEDELEFASGAKIKICNDCNHVLIDSKITSFGKCTFDVFINTTDIDIANNSYEHSKIKSEDSFCHWSFRKVGTKTTGCDMKFLKALDPNERAKMLNDEKRAYYFGYSKVVYGGIHYKEVD